MLSFILYHQRQLTYYLCSFACMTSLTSRHNLIIQKFTTSWIHEKWSKRTKNCELRKRFKIFSKLWVMTSRVSGACRRGHWRSLFYETVKNFFFGKCSLNCKKMSLKMKIMYLNFDKWTLSQLSFDGLWQ